MFKCINSHVFGEYSFSGMCIPSASVQLTLKPEDLKHIRNEIKKLSQARTYDYVLVFENDNGDRVLAIDNISESDKEELRSAGYAKDIPHHDYYSLVFDNSSIFS